jgi:hypothetical protein
MTQKMITMTGSGWPFIDSRITFYGHFPQPGAKIKITRVGPAGTVALGRLTVDANGNFGFSDTPAVVGSYKYNAYFPGSTYTYSYSKTDPVVITLVPATMTLSGPASNPLGKTLTVKGTLFYAAGARHVPVGTKITITRTGVGTARKVFTVRTGAGGTFSLTDKPTVTGKYTYAARFAGSATTTKAAVAVHVTEVKAS